MTKVKSKKASAKFKISEKQKVNKWLILGGVVAVALAGMVIVRLSSASSWVSVGRSTAGWKITSNGRAIDVKAKLVKGRRYRVCARGSNFGGLSNVSIQALNNITTSRMVSTTRTYTSSDSLQCTTTFTAPGSGYIVLPLFWKTSGPDVWLRAVSVDELH